MSEREPQMRFKDRRNGLQRKVGTYTETVDNREVVKPIRVYVGNTKVARV